MTARHHRVPVLVLLFAAAAVVTFAGCAKQGEGERCVSATNGNNDCQTGLVCVPAEQLQQPGADRCCPPDGQQIHVSTCTRSNSIVNTGGSGGTEAGTGGSGGTEAGTAGSGGTKAGTAGSGGTKAGTAGSGGATGGSGGSSGGAGGAHDAGAD